MPTEPDANGWYPMSSAPKDERIDLWHERGYRVPNCFWTENRKRHLGVTQTGWTEPDGSTNHAIHYVAWRREPLPPVATLKPTETRAHGAE